MRIFSIISAIAVCGILYLVIMERPALIAFAERFQAPVEDTDLPEAALSGEDTAASEADASESDPAEDEVMDLSEAETAGDSSSEEMAEGDATAPSLDTDADGGTADEARVAVVVLPSTAELIDSAVPLRGRTEAARQVDVRAETSGLIISQPIRAGAFVEEGTLLCEIAPSTRLSDLLEAQARLAEAQARIPEAESRVEEAMARLAEAEINNTAAARLSESGFGSETRAVSTAASVSAAEAAIRSAQAGVEAAESGVQSAQAGVTRAEEEIERLQIFAPFAGHLESDTAELGSLMQPGAQCATIIQLDPIKLVGFVPESQVNRIAVGALAGARLASGAEVQGEVTFLSRSADPDTRTFRVEITVENDDFAIRDGQTADILIASDGLQAHLLPTSSMTLNDDGVLGVRIVDEDNITRFLPVTFLRDTVDGVLLAGLPDEVDVIIVGQEFVTDGVPVDPHEQELMQ